MRYGLYLGSEEFAFELKERLQGERHREKPQARTALSEDGILAILEKVLFALGVKDHKSLLRPLRRTQRPERDLAIFILCHLGFSSHQEIAGVFGVGYTAITGALKRAEEHMGASKKMKRRVEKVLNDI